MGQVSVWILSMTRSPFRAGVAHLPWYLWRDYLTELTTTAEAEENLEDLISDILGQDFIKQWPISTDGTDILSNRELHYCPRLDFAVGPFNIHRQVDKDRRRIMRAFRQNRRIISALEELDRSVIVSEEDLNDSIPREKRDNPRCFMAIEIERSTGTKHRMGSIINAGALGKVGLVIGIGEDAYNSLIRIRKYISLLRSVGKISYEPKNVLILKYEETINVLSEFRRRNRARQ